MTGFRVGALLLAAVSSAVADSPSNVVVWPPVDADGKPAFTRVTGLRLSFESLWFTPGGYRPVRVRVEADQARQQDRVVDVTLTAFDPNDADSRRVTATRSLTIRKGGSAVETVVLVPSLAAVTSFRCDARVDGVPDEELESPAPGFVWQTARVTSGLRTITPFGGSASSSLTTAKPDGWLAYSAADVAVVSLERLEGAASIEDQRWVELRRWVLAGGTLWVEGAGESPEAYRVIDDLLGIDGWRFRAVDSERETDVAEDRSQAKTTDEGAEEDADASEKKRRLVRPIDGAPGWGYALLEADERLLDGAAALKAGDFGRAIQALAGPSRDSRGWFAQREAGFGRVLAFSRSESDLPDRLRFGQSESFRATWRDRAWRARHGIEPGGKSPQFGNLLIPGVGVAPVNEFQVLITLFVLTIGPLNYWLLWRCQQLQLLVVTVPLCALAATLGLAAYAAVSDGFGVKARARSVTLLDQTGGEAASWSRVTHYVATAPDEPPAFPSDCAIYPIEPAWETAIAQTDSRREVSWTPRGQELMSGWLPSRTAVQHLLVRCRETPARVDFEQDDGAFHITNRLGAPIDLLLTRDADGDWWSAESVGESERVSLERTDRLAGLQAYRTIAIQNEPEFPVGAGKAVEDALERLGAGRDVRRMQRTFADVNLGDNLGERRLASVSGLDGGRSLDLPPKTFVAVTSQAVETPLGWDEVQEVGSFHVVVGRW